ncbi:axin-2-like isoform X2 [Artemia franciscana]|uniref:axin-2-like isoform X2 n=1 Tax=Artemia franciscana TaxID=6661 RepID=UPI0032DA77D4
MEFSCWGCEIENRLLCDNFEIEGCSSHSTCSSDCNQRREDLEKCRDIFDCFYDIRREIESTRSSSPPTPGSPSYLRWSEDLHNLLLDQDGVELYRQFMESEGCGHLFEFWFACEGLKLHGSDIVPTVKAINRKYVRSRKVPLSEEVRRDINDKISAKSEIDARIFDAAQKECEMQMRNSTFPNFFKSDIFLDYVHKKQDAGQGVESPKMESNRGDESDTESVDFPRNPNTRTLPTVMEDMELPTTSLATSSKSAALAPLTRKALEATQTRRLYTTDARQKSEVFARTISRSAPSPYSVYNPCPVVSRQDSEAQSMSSGAHTDDAMSCTSSTLELRSGLRHPPTRKYAVYIEPKNKEVASGLPLHTHVPRTDRLVKEQITPQDPEKFAKILIHKLELVARNREIEDKVRRVHEGDDEVPMPLPHAPHYSVDKVCLQEALKKITAPTVEDDLDQDILDAHVKRVWADRTPLRSPGVASPRPWSPDMKKKSHSGKSMLPPVCPLSNRPPPVGAHPGHHRRKDREGVSLLSSDSGLVDHNDSHMSKSRSVPDYNDIQRSLPVDSYCRSKDPRRPPNIYPSTTSPTKRKASAYEADSGVGLVYDSQSSLQNVPLAPKHVLNWVAETAKLHADEMQKQKAANATSPGSSRRSRKHGYSSSRSESLERSAIVPLATLGPHGSSWGSDSGLSNAYPVLNKQRMSNTPVDMANSMSSMGNMRRPRPSTSAAPQAEHTIVTFTFCDEKVPYRTKVYSHSVTLHQFKKLLPKGRHGNYRFYFKTVCDDDLTSAVNLEVMEDEEELPTWDGKIVGTVRLAE